MCEAKISGLFKICHHKQPNTVVVVVVVTFEQKNSLYKINSQETAEAFILLTYFTFSLLSLFQSLLSFDSNETCYAFRTCTRKHLQNCYFLAYTTLGNIITSIEKILPRK